jgi:hypothetical protein
MLVRVREPTEIVSPDCAAKLTPESIKVPFPVTLVLLNTTLLEGVAVGKLRVTPEGILRVAAVTVTLELNVTEVEDPAALEKGVEATILAGPLNVTVGTLMKVRGAATVVVPEKRIEEGDEALKVVGPEKVKLGVN